MSDELDTMRHSLAHIMANAVQHLWPEAKFGIGPAIENGFYYDIDLGDNKISDEDFPKIEKEMRKIIGQDQPFVHSTKPIEMAIKWAKDNKQPYKTELLNDLKREGTTRANELNAAMMGVEANVLAGGLGISPAKAKVSEVGFYTNGDFEDLCRGLHVVSTAKVGAFKLMRVAGAYWRGDEKKPQMQRLYGAAFKTKEELKKHIQQLEQAKLRDHRKLGKEMDLFTISDMVGSGLPMFTPRGTWLRELLGGYSQQLRAQRGFKRVWTPHITKPDLYKASGHWAKFGDELFQVTSQETSDVFAMKPMNCPHHTRIYASQPRSYRDLPIRYMENATDYRDEKTGELHGLSRVRSFTQDDCHVFCRQNQIEDEVTQLVQAAQELYQELDMEIKFNLSFRDEGEGYLGEKKLWSEAETKLEQLAGDNKLDYKIDRGEAAFYGPKIDFIAVDGLGREWQVATVQLDFVQPSRLDLDYTDETGAKQTPVMIHSALLGSIERFLSVYIEHTAGHFPFWLAPEQVRILTINDTVLDYVAKIEKVLNGALLMHPLKYNEIRFTRDDRNESLGKKIREAEKAKVPLVLIVGPKDQEAKQVSVRTQQGESKVSIDKLAELLQSTK